MSVDPPTDLFTVLQVTGLSVDDLLKPAGTMPKEPFRAVGVENPDWYATAFRYGYEIGDQFFPRQPPSGDYLLGWNHGREARGRSLPGGAQDRR